MKGSLRERSPGVWQTRVSLGHDPETHRYRYAQATARGGRRDAQRAAARLVSEAAQGRIPLTKETFGGLLVRWLDHLIERAEEKDPGLATLPFVAATTGCRRGELCGLRWSDVDFEKEVPLLVPRQVKGSRDND